MAALMYKWFLALTLVFPGGNADEVGADQHAGLHPFYLSVIEISHNAGAATLEISCKIFADDLEAILEKNNQTTLDITTEKDRARFDKFISAYMFRNLSLQVDGKPVKLNYIGFENDKETAYVYLEAESIAAPKKVHINTSLLYDYAESQSNIVHVIVNGKRKSVRLDNPAGEADFSF